MTVRIGDHREAYSMLAAACVAVVFWCIQTDKFPIPQGFRPSWYVYGWPICFATSGRGRFHFSSFDSISLAIDLLVTVLTIVSTWLAGRHILKGIPRFSIGQLIAVTAGVALFCFIAFGAMNVVLHSLGFPMPHEDYSATAGYARRWERYSLFSQIPVGLGVFSIGYVFTVTGLGLLKIKEETDKGRHS